MGAIQAKEPEEVNYNYKLVKGKRYVIQKNAEHFSSPKIYDNFDYRNTPKTVIGYYEQSSTNVVVSTMGPDDIGYIKIVTKYQFYNVISLEETNENFKEIKKGREVFLFDENLIKFRNLNYNNFLLEILKIHEKNKEFNKNKFSIVSYVVKSPSLELLLENGKIFKMYRLKYDILNDIDKEKETIEKQLLLDSLINYTLGEEISEDKNVLNELTKNYIKDESENLHNFMELEEFSYNPNKSKINYKPSIRVTDNNIKNIKELVKPTRFSILDTLKSKSKGRNILTYGGKYKKTKKKYCKCKKKHSSFLKKKNKRKTCKKSFK